MKHIIPAWAALVSVAAMGCSVEPDEVAICEAAAEHLKGCGLPSAKAAQGADVCIGEFASELLDYECDELKAAVDLKAEGEELDDACEAADLCVNSFYFEANVCAALGAACQSRELKADSGSCKCNKRRDRCLSEAYDIDKDRKRAEVASECRSDASDCRDDCGWHSGKRKHCGHGKKWSKKKDKCVKKKHKHRDRDDDDDDEGIIEGFVDWLL